MASEKTTQSTGAVPVLMFHSIATDAAPGFRRFAVHPGDFAAQMDYLAAGGYSPITAAALAASRSSGQPLPSRAVVLTFDDAFADFCTTALPVLRRHGFPATLYVPTSYVGSTARWLQPCGEGNRQMLSWQALRDISAEGIEVAAHSHTHPQLDRLPANVIVEEVRRSRRVLEDTLGSEVGGFAYPFGYWNRAARSAVAGAGFRYACAVDELTTRPGDDMFTLPRLTVNAGIGVAGLAQLLASRPAPGDRWVAAGKRIAWQAARKAVRAVGGDPREGQGT